MDPPKVEKRDLIHPCLATPETEKNHGRRRTPPRAVMEFDVLSSGAVPAGLAAAIR